MDVVLCTYDSRDGSIGGPIGWALDFIPSLEDSDLDLAVIVLRRDGAAGSQIAERCQELGVQVHVMDTSIQNTIESQVEWLVQCLHRIQCKIVISNHVLPALFATRWFRRMKITTIGVVHSNPLFDQFYRDFLDVFVGGEARNQLDVVIATSKEISNLVDRSAEAAPIRIETIPCGGKRSSQIATPPSGELRLVYLGRLVEKQKRIRATTEALIDVCKEIGATASIYGNGDQEMWLTERLENNASVRYFGGIPPKEVYHALARNHAFVLLSDYEGMPIALIEAMSCGLVPICLSTSSGPNEVITDQVNGFLVDDRREAFSKAVRSLAQPGVWTRMSAAAIATVDQEYLHEVTFAKWHRLLAELANSAETFRRLRSFRANLNEYSVKFSGCPPHRRTRNQVARDLVAETFFRFRQIARPRARLRQLLGDRRNFRK